MTSLRNDGKSMCWGFIANCGRYTSYTDQGMKLLSFMVM